MLCTHERGNLSDHPEGGSQIQIQDLIPVFIVHIRQHFRVIAACGIDQNVHTAHLLGASLRYFCGAFFGSDVTGQKMALHSAAFCQFDQILTTVRMTADKKNVAAVFDQACSHGAAEALRSA